MRRNWSKDAEKGLSILWKHMLMMMGILALALIAMMINHQQSVETITEEHLKRYGIAFDRDCATLNQSMYATKSIPASIESSFFYSYIKQEDSGVLDKKYYPILNYIRMAFGDQVYLKGNSKLSLLYMDGCNSIVGNGKNFPVAEDCFKRYLVFAEADGEVILGHLRNQGDVTLLPVQPVKIGKSGYSPCLALIIRPEDSRTAVMSVYDEQTLLDSFGFQHLPEGSHLQLTAKDGQILYQYPTAITEDVAQQCYLLESRMEDFDVSVRLWVPRQHFKQILQPVHISGIVSIIVVFLIGTALSFVFSKASVRPIRALISAHDLVPIKENRNEITHLDQVLRNSKHHSEELQSRLFIQVLARALSGSALSPEEERQLEQRLHGLSENYRVAVLHSTGDINDLMESQMLTVLSQGLWVTMNERETCLLFEGREEQVDILMREVERINGQFGGAIYCGISAKSDSLQELHTAVCQAKVAFPQAAGCNLFPGALFNDHGISRLQQERIYQSIFANDADSAAMLLKNIAKQAHNGNIREVFYNVRFILRSAAEQLEIPFLIGSDLEYNSNLLPRENIQVLERMLEDLFLRIREKNQIKTATRKDRVMEYIKHHYSDYDLCAAVVAERFQASEKWVYELVREKTELSFNEYLLSLRMERAAYLLVTTQSGVAEIANQCGYQATSTFFRVFKKYHGISPGQYRTEGPVEKE